MTYAYDIIVIGAGHAGCEAARAAALLGQSTLLITMDMEKIAQMSCNPAVGGIAKGQIVREIDALGGAMGVITDRSAIQFRMLNRSKGAAMWSPRAQSDRHLFSRYWRYELEHTDNLEMYQDTVASLLIDDSEEKPRVEGVRTAGGAEFHARAVILTAGTFLNGLMHVGRVMTPGGRISEGVASGLTEQLVGLGLHADRMKTGTPARIDGRTVDFSLAQEQNGDDTWEKFSFLPGIGRELPQRACYIVNTNSMTHDVLREGLPESPLYNGQIQSIGPRYCPSIETKIVTFADKESHQLFLEPEGVDTNEYYLNGFSSSLPANIQIKALETIPALRDVNIYRPGYAIEYDFFDPTDLHHTLESKFVDGLYLAGQVNGTTGYEEAAGQGLMAGINASRSLDGLDPIVLDRDKAYIGVLIDDLVMKGVDEPYRMFTSRAEYRILLRQDNADVRLTPLGREIGLVDDARWTSFQSKQAQLEALSGYLQSTPVKVETANRMLERLGGSPVTQGVRLADLLSRPEVKIFDLLKYLPGVEESILGIVEQPRFREILQTAETLVKYRGYIERERLTADKLKRLDGVKLRGRLDYDRLTALSTEARQKLKRHDPETVGQASRIPGVSPADINMLLLLLGK